jgi:hypothetical protein
VGHHDHRSLRDVSGFRLSPQQALEPAMNVGEVRRTIPVEALLHRLEATHEDVDGILQRPLGRGATAPDAGASLRDEAGVVEDQELGLEHSRIGLPEAVQDPAFQLLELRAGAATRLVEALDLLLHLPGRYRLVPDALDLRTEEERLADGNPLANRDPVQDLGH